MTTVRDQRGIGATELAVIAPVLLLLLLGIADIVNFYRAKLRMDTAAVQIGQIVSQCTSISAGDIAEFWAYGQSIVGGLTNLTATNRSGAVVVSAVAMVNGTAKVRWQRRAGIASYVSSVGKEDNPPSNATLSGAMVPAGQTLFVVEVTGAVPAFVFSDGIIAPYLGRLTAITLFLSRAPNPAALQSPPTTSTNRDCTA